MIHPPAATRPRGLFFVMGAPKSGTTWTEALLNAHPQVSCFGEGHFIDQVAQPLEAMLRHYNQQLSLVGARVYEGKPAYAMLDDAEIRELVRPMVVSLMRRAGPDATALWWGDKTPAYAKQLRGLHSLFPQARFIHVVRDPRDVAVSSLYHAKRAGILPDLAANPGLRNGLVRNAVSRWREHIDGIVAADEWLGSRLLEVLYADLVEDPAPQLRRLFGHLEGIVVTDPIIADVMAQCAFQVMSGGRAAGQVDNSSFFRAGVNGQYLTELSNAEIDYIEAELAPQMARYGFIWPPDHEPSP